MKRSTLFLVASLWLGRLLSPAVQAEQIDLDISLTYPTMKADEKTTNYLKVKLTAFDLPKDGTRVPVNVAIVLDRSGSMSGEKLEQAKAAALTAVDRLQDNDIVSVLTYDESIHVLIPATRATDRESIQQAIRSIQVGGSTALFGGVSKGAAEVRKFMDDQHVNRVVLLSDGMANVGPSSPMELQQLGESLLKEGISVSTLGLGAGYNEDLMRSLAAASSGNHVFIENADNLVAVFNNEFDDILSVVATDVHLKIDLDPSVRPVRVLNTEADIEGQEVMLSLTQLYARQERYYIVEVEVDAGKNETERPLAKVDLQYRNMQTETKDDLSSSVAVRFSNEVESIEADTNLEALAFCTVQLAAIRNREATALRDAGKIEEARKLLNFNCSVLGEVQTRCEKNGIRIADLDYGNRLNIMQAEEIGDNSKWNFNRKLMRDYQQSTSEQQTYDNRGKTGR
jgi:Ca-activated chloride channel family protein